MGKGTIVLAYSGGLDTSICIPLLKERYEYDRVVTVAVNVGQRDEEIEVATRKGKKMADRHYTIDVRERFVREHIFPAIKANGSYEGYPMGTSLARPLIAEEVVKIARKGGCNGYRPRVHGQRQRPAPVRFHHPQRRARSRGPYP